VRNQDAGDHSLISGPEFRYFSGLVKRKPFGRAAVHRPSPSGSIWTIVGEAGKKLLGRFRLFAFFQAVFAGAASPDFATPGATVPFTHMPYLQIGFGSLKQLSYHARHDMPSIISGF
jgi:hypothetical protein